MGWFRKMIVRSFGSSETNRSSGGTGGHARELPHREESYGIAFRVGVHSSQGPRGENDDYALSGELDTCFAISDGIGGAPFGNIISRTACNVALSAFGEGKDCQKAFAQANQAAITVKEWIDSPSSGATLLLAEQRNTIMQFAWVGDTVAYRLRAGCFEQLTEIGRQGQSNALDSAIGYDAFLEPRITECDILPDDRFLLCSDGVWDVLSQDEMSYILSTGINAPMAASNLVNEAIKTGHDNATAVVLFAKEGTRVPVVSNQDGCATPSLSVLDDYDYDTDDGDSDACDK